MRFDEPSGKLDENAQAIFEKLRGVGFSVPVIAGIMGNLYVESFFRADARAPSGTHRELLETCEEYRRLYGEEDRAR